MNRATCHPGVLIFPWPHLESPPEELCHSLARHCGARAVPLVVFETQDGKHWLFGADQRETLLGPYSKEHNSSAISAILTSPDRASANDLCQRLLDSLRTTGMPGVVNSGLFAANVLKRAARDAEISTTERLTPSSCGAELLLGLGFHFEGNDSDALQTLTSANGQRLGMAILDPPHQARNTFNFARLAAGISASASAGLSWLLALSGPRIRLYPVGPGRGVDYRGLAATYLEIDLSLLGKDARSLLFTLMSPSGLAANGVAETLLDASCREAAATAKRLRTQIIDCALPRLAMGVAQAMADDGETLGASELELAHAATSRLLVRLVIQTIWTARGLLKGGGEISSLARELFLDGRVGGNLWSRLSAEWQILANHGEGLFAADTAEGNLIARISLPNSVMEPVMKALLLEADGGRHTLPDLATLPLREIGTLYEELLGRMPTSTFEEFLPSGDQLPGRAPVLAPADQASPRKVNRRKATGSYFTPTFLVKHLIERSLVPAVEEHLERFVEGVDALIASKDPERIADAIFGIRVCDLSMGSGHFLLPAIDCIESKVATVIARWPQLLEIMAGSKAKAMQLDASDVGARLRRETAERCVYGVDIDPVAVEIARFAIRAHASIPGSILPHPTPGLVWGEALTGIASIEEAQEVFSRLASTDDGVGRGAEAHRVLLELQSLPFKDLRDRSDRLRSYADLLDAASGCRSTETEVRPVHMPLHFPEVFCREDSPGFHVVIGNPPFLSQLNQNAAAATGERKRLRHHFGAKIGTQFDRSAVFMLRAIELVRNDHGRIGLIQPLSFLSAAHAEGCRREVAAAGTVESLWIGLDRVFPANVRTCAPSIVLGTQRVVDVERFSGTGLLPLPAIKMDFDLLGAEPTWGKLASGVRTTPVVRLRQESKLGSVSSAAADFRDQFYGLADATVNASSGLGPSQRALITSGLIDPLESLWGRRTAKINGVQYSNPAVDLALLAVKSPALSRWATNRLVPKLLVATQSRVIEVLPDPAGLLLPAVPVITVLPDPEHFWEVAAALLSPALCAYALDTYLGSALSADAIKLSAKQVLELPAPTDAEAWRLAAQEAKTLFTRNSQTPEAWRRFGAAALAAYRLDDPTLLAWWLARIAKRTPAAFSQ